MSAVQDNPFDRNLDAFLGTRVPERSGAVGAARTLVLVGNLPVMSGLWLSQYADRESRERGAVCMLRIDDDAVQLELFVSNGRRPTVRPQATLAEALRAIAPAVAAWLVVPRHSDTIVVPADASDIMVLTGADDPAVVAAYTLVKRCVESIESRAATRGEQRAAPRISVTVLGATDAESVFVEQKLDKTTRAFLDVALPVRGGLQRVSPVESAFRGTFDAHAPLIDDLFAMIRAAEAASAAEPPARQERGERFSPRGERVAPRRTLVDPGPIPFTRSAAVPPMPIAAARATVAAARETLDEAARTLPARGTTIEPKTVEPKTIEPKSAPTAPAPTPIAAPSATASLPPEPLAPARARIVKGELPAQLVPEIPGLEPISLRAPRDKDIELALDGEGRLHIVGRATDAAAILRVRGWARDHAELLAMANPRIARAEPMVDLVVADLREARSIDGVTVHVLTLVEVAGRRAYLAQVAPA